MSRLATGLAIGQWRGGCRGTRRPRTTRGPTLAALLLALGAAPCQALVAGVEALAGAVTALLLVWRGLGLALGGQHVDAVHGTRGQA